MSAADRVSLLRDLVPSEGVADPAQTAGWCWAHSRTLLVAERSDEGDPRTMPARALRLLTTPLGERAHDVATLLSWLEAHGPKPTPCETCAGTGRRRRECGHCDQTHECVCTACDGAGRRQPDAWDLGATVALADVPFRALAAAPLLRWLLAVGVTSARVAHVVAGTLQGDGAVLVLGDDTHRAAIGSAVPNAVDLLTPTFAEVL